jgi:hypothetical protein
MLAQLPETHPEEEALANEAVSARERVLADAGLLAPVS